MFLSFQYGLRPTRAQHRALDAILEGQRLLYNAALQERTEAWRKARTSITWLIRAGRSPSFAPTIRMATAHCR